MSSLKSVIRSATPLSLVLALVGSTVCVPAMAQPSPQQQTGTATPPAMGDPAKPPGAQQDVSRQHPTAAEGGGEAGHPTAVGTVDPLTKDREAFFSAHLAALHAGLTLTADQEALWGPVEAAIRTLDKTHNLHQSREDIAGLLSQSPSDLLRMRGEQLTQRGDAMRKLAEATAPLVERLDGAQKNRLPLLLEGMRPASVLRAAFDIRFGKVVDDPDDGSDGQNGEHGGNRHTSSGSGDDSDNHMSQSRSRNASQDGMNAGDDHYRRSESDDRGREQMRSRGDRFDMGDDDRS